MERLKILVVEDSYVCRSIMQKILQPYGDCDLAKDGREAILAVKLALAEHGQNYDLICLDSIMPNLGGVDTLVKIHDVEDDKGFPIGRGSKIVMMTSKDDHTSIMESFKNACDGYLVKPIRPVSLYNKLEELGLITRSEELEAVLLC